MSDFARHLAPFGGRKIHLRNCSTDETPGFEGRKRARKKLEGEHERLQELQGVLFAEGKRKVLVVLQALDTGGKDGTIRKVMGPVNPQGVKVHGFKKPSAEEASHHFLWRVRKALPGTGMIGVFNRSHYEDILVPSVYDLLPAHSIDKRYREIRNFEEALVQKGCAIVKFFLHISRAEQKRRLQDRLDDPSKRWKFNPQDLDARARWDDFQDVYSRILSETSVKHAPWYIVPADHKWYRDIVVARVLRKTLEDMDLRYPESPSGLEDIVIPD